MRLFIRPSAPAVLAGIAVLALSSCRPSPTVSQNESPGAARGEPIHGELIAPASKPAPPPAQPAAAQVAAAPAAPISALASSPATTAPVAPPVPTPVVETTKPAMAVPAPVSVVDGYATVGFDKLASYNFEVDDAPVTNQTAAADKANGQIPARVKAFNGEKVSIKGFMLPLKVADGKVTEFLIMKDQSMCCYGTVPKITEWVSVKTPGKGVKPIMDQPVSIEGTLHVGALRENGYLVGIYQMDGDKLDTGGN